MLVRPYEMPWRPAYEAWAAAAWLGTAGAAALAGAIFFAVMQQVLEWWGARRLAAQTRTQAQAQARGHVPAGSLWGKLA